MFSGVHFFLREYQAAAIDSRKVLLVYMTRIDL